jgi:hypothetical protein
MTMLALYPTKKEIKANIGKKLKYRETSAFGNEYKSDGSFTVCNRPSITGMGREWFAVVTMKEGLISKVE